MHLAVFLLFVYVAIARSISHHSLKPVLTVKETGRRPPALPNMFYLPTDDKRSRARLGLLRVCQEGSCPSSHSAKRPGGTQLARHADFLERQADTLLAVASSYAEIGEIGELGKAAERKREAMRLYEEAASPSRTASQMGHSS